MMGQNNEFTFRLVGTTGCEILFNGTVVAWAVDEMWAALLAQVLNHHPCVTVGVGMDYPAQLVAAEGADNRDERFSIKGKRE